MKQRLAFICANVRSYVYKLRLSSTLHHGKPGVTGEVSAQFLKRQSEFEISSLDRALGPTPCLQ